MKFLLGQHIFNKNIFCIANLNYSVSKKQSRKLNKRKINKINFIKENWIKLKINSRVSKLFTFITGRLTPWIIVSYLRTASNNQASKQSSQTTRVLQVYGVSMSNKGISYCFE